MDKTTKITEPHKLWNLSRKISDLIAVIGSMKEFELPVTSDMTKKLYLMCSDLFHSACDFDDFINETEDTTSSVD